MTDKRSIDLDDGLPARVAGSGVRQVAWLREGAWRRVAVIARFIDTSAAARMG